MPHFTEWSHTSHNMEYELVNFQLIFFQNLSTRKYVIGCNGCNVTTVNCPWKGRYTLPVFTGRRHGPWTRESKMTPVFTGRVDGPWTRVACTERKTNRRTRRRRRLAETGRFRTRHDRARECDRWRWSVIANSSSSSRSIRSGKTAAAADCGWTAHGTRGVSLATSDIRWRSGEVSK